MSVIDDYLKDFPASQQAELNRIRTIVKEMCPDAEETLGYGIPTFKYRGKNLVHFAAFKDHMSFFPTSTPIAELDEKVAKYKTGKGTLQFTEDNPIPEDVIRDLVKIRLEDIN